MTGRSGEQATVDVEREDLLVRHIRLAQPEVCALVDEPTDDRGTQCRIRDEPGHAGHEVGSLLHQRRPFDHRGTLAISALHATALIGKTPGMSIELIPLCTATATLAEPFFLPNTPTGTRVIAEVQSFDVEGERIRASMKGSAAADWMVLGPTGIGTLDVRALLETDDGALVYTWYHGRLDLSRGAGASPVYSAPLYETGDERYAWLNAIQAVGKGTLSADAHTLVYEIAEVR